MLSFQIPIVSIPSSLGNLEPQYSTLGGQHPPECQSNLALKGTFTTQSGGRKFIFYNLMAKLKRNNLNSLCVTIPPSIRISIPYGKLSTFRLKTRNCFSR